MSTSENLPTVRSFAYKREAQQYLESAQNMYGGQWTLDSYGRGQHFVKQVFTKAQILERQALKHATLTLDPEYDWFTGRFGAKRNLEQLKTILDEFQTNFAKDPCYALRWADKVCTAAAEYQVVSTIMHMHDNGSDPKNICAAIEERAARKVEHESLSSSSSPMSNIMETAERIALNKYARNLRSHIDAQAEAIGTLAVL